MENEKREIRFMCCFCAKDVARGEGIVVVADLHPGEEVDSGWQQWWAHPRCFATVVHPDARHFRDEIQEAIDNDKVSEFLTWEERERE